MHGILRHAVPKDLVVFGMPAVVVLICGLIVCAGEGYDGLTETLWRLATGERALSDLSFANGLGQALFVVGLTVVLVGVFTLKRSYAPTLLVWEDLRLVTHGIYRYVRHPVYLGVLVAIAGAPVYASSPSGAVVLSALVPLFLLRIRMEERLLAEHFGDAYRAYLARTRRLISWAPRARPAPAAERSPC